VKLRRKIVKIRQKKMKAITAVCSTGASVPSIASGRVSRHRDGENAEVQMYISKLKDLVPFMPKNRKLSKLEVIQNVIQYICDLQTALDADPAVSEFDAAAVLASQNHLLEQVSPRQPLHVRPSPNTILPSSNNNTSPTSIPASQHIYGTSNEYSSINHNVSVQKPRKAHLLPTVSCSSHHGCVKNLRKQP
jgi:DNA-binding protein inhibitor ID